jgi:rSAM-associated Gly-rich repeat protein
MTFRSRTKKLLSILLPVGVLGVSAALAAAHTKPLATADEGTSPQDDAGMGVAAQLQVIRNSVSALEGEIPEDADADTKIFLAQWGNFGGGGFGWRNGGWRNGGWRNGGWRNGGWGNGGWRPWGNGGWHNFWRNW